MHRFIRTLSRLLPLLGLLSGSIHAAEFVYVGHLDDRGHCAECRTILRDRREHGDARAV